LNWRPQTEFLAKHEFHFIGHLESLVRDFQTVGKRLGIATPLRVSNVTNYDDGDAAGQCVADWPLHRLRRMVAQPHFLRFYTPDLLVRVGQLYASDVERFGYSAADAAAQSRAA
jgi:hypothetical protein